MTNQEIKELLQMFEESGVAEMEVQRGENRLRPRQGDEDARNRTVAAAAPAPPAPAAASGCGAETIRARSQPYSGQIAHCRDLLRCALA